MIYITHTRLVVKLLAMFAMTSIILVSFNHILVSHALDVMQNELANGFEKMGPNEIVSIEDIMTDTIQKGMNVTQGKDMETDLRRSQDTFLSTIPIINMIAGKAVIPKCIKG